MILFSLILSSLLSLSAMDEPRTSIVWHWEDEFSVTEREKVEEWLNKVTVATESTIGPYPFTLHFFIHRRNGASEPVPWANTRRHPLQGVDFHIDPAYSLQAFLDDWTAPHEISHLSIPYLGRSEAWFAEGFASFMQYQIMQRLGIYSRQEVRERYSQKIESVRPYFDGDQDFVTVSRELQRRNNYPAMYWGGASYFMHMDQRLKAELNMEFTTLIKDYLICCRLKDDSLEQLIDSWDRLIGDFLFANMLQSYQADPASGILEADFLNQVED
jgi:hypothetical protein